MPTAVLMMIGQTAVMKITKIAEGWPSWKAASDSGSQASGGTVRSTWKIGSSPRMAQTNWPISVPSAMPTTAAIAVAESDALKAGQDMPEQALVEAGADQERIDDQLPGVGDDLASAPARGAGLAADELPDGGRTTSVMSGGTTRSRRRPGNVRQARPRQLRSRDGRATTWSPSATRRFCRSI